MKRPDQRKLQGDLGKKGQQVKFSPLANILAAIHELIPKGLRPRPHKSNPTKQIWRAKGLNQPVLMGSPSTSNGDNSFQDALDIANSSDGEELADLATSNNSPKWLYGQMGEKESVNGSTPAYTKVRESSVVPSS